MKEFHTIVRPLGDTRLVGTEPSQWRDETIATWRVDSQSPALASQSFTLPYEAYAEKLSGIPRLFLEPDGSFVWVLSEDASRRISGQITDDGQRVLYLELRGRCLWDDLLAVLGPLDTDASGLDFAFQLLPEAFLVKEETFRELVCGDD